MSCCGRPSSIKVEMPKKSTAMPLKVKPTSKLKTPVDLKSYNDRERHRV